jgi:DNA-binding LacI/PurR family transcriptional regulator
MGVVAMGLLREAMEQKDQRLCRKVVLQTELVIRESCGAGLRESIRKENP